MKKSNVLFIAMIGASLALISAIMTDNITSVPPQPGGFTAAAMTPDPENARNAEAARQAFNRMGLSLHEGKYWKETHE